MPENLIDFSTYVKEKEAAALEPKPHDCRPPKHKAEVLLLTCMDFRFFLKIADEMKDIRYDHVILAGAALGAVVEDTKDTWHPTFIDHLKLAIELHCIEEVWVIEHRECGAYGPRPGFGLLPDPPDRYGTEHDVHMAQAELLRVKLLPFGLKFESWLLNVPRPGEDAITFDKLT
jgi:hypothetical protein